MEAYVGSSATSSSVHRRTTRLEHGRAPVARVARRAKGMHMHNAEGTRGAPAPDLRTTSAGETAFTLRHAPSHVPAAHRLPQALASSRSRNTHGWCSEPSTKRTMWMAGTFERLPVAWRAPCPGAVPGPVPVLAGKVQVPHARRVTRSRARAGRRRWPAGGRCRTHASCVLRSYCIACTSIHV